MAISFNSIPNDIRVPGSFAEFDSSNASSGASLQPYKILAFGNKLSAGTQPAEQLVRVASDKAADTLFGKGSMLSAMLKKIRLNNDFTEIYAIGLEDNGAGVAATGSVTFTGTATADGIVNLYIGGVNYQIGVLAGDSPTVIATSAAAKISADSDAQVLGVVDGTLASKVNITSKHKGEFGNAITAIVNYNGEALPAGVTVAFSALASGAGNPAIAAAIAAMGEDQFRTIAFPYQDATNLSLLEAELDRRWGPLTQNDSSVFLGSNLSSSAAMTFGLTRNSPFVSTMLVSMSPSPSWEIAGATAGVIAFESAIDPARPVQTVVLKGILAPAPSDRLLLSENNALLYSGISTSMVDVSGLVRIQKLITMYRQNGAGVADTAYLEYTTIANLSYIRYDWRTYFGVKYARFKLADDGNKFETGQKIMTPKLAKAECVALYARWMEKGLVENLDVFKASLVVERNGSNRNRLDFLIPPNLINGLDILAARFAFIV